MAFEIIYPFTTAGNYIFDSDKIEFNGGIAQLKLIDNTGQTYNQPFTADTGFTYDNTKVEFSGGVIQQIDLSIVGATFAANYEVDEDGNYGDGSLTGTLVNGATVAGGFLNLTGGSTKECTYVATGMINALTGAIRFIYKPNYTGNPSSNVNLFLYQNSSGDNPNELFLVHDTASAWRLSARTNTGSIAMLGVGMGTSVLTAGVEYEIELNWKFDPLGATTLFVDGIQTSGTLTNTPTRDNNTTSVTYFSAGGNGAFTDQEMDDFVWFTTPQHTSNYTPGYTVTDRRFLGSSVTLPDFTYPGVGTTQGFTIFATTETNAPRYIMNDEYWTGSAWAASDGTYAQANIFSVINTNIGTLTVADTLTVKLVFTDLNTISDVDDLTTTYTGQIYPTDNPTIQPTITIDADGLNTFASVLTATGSDAVQFTICVDGVEKYWDGGAWSDSSGFAQSNTSADINTNITSLDISTGAVIKPTTHLHSDDGSTTPNIDSITINYDFFNPADALPLMCHVSGYLIDSNNTIIPGGIVEANIDTTSGELTAEKNYWVSGNKISTTSNVNGYFEFDLIRSTEFQGTVVYDFTITETDSTNRFIVQNRIIPNLTSVDFNDLEEQQ